MNPYQGCYHNCVYCDGKSEYYHMHEDFGDRIFVKENAPQLFKKFLKNKGFLPVHSKEQSAIDEFFPSLKEIPDSKVAPKTIITIGGVIGGGMIPPYFFLRRILMIAFNASFNTNVWPVNIFFYNNIFLIFENFRI